MKKMKKLSLLLLVFLYCHRIEAQKRDFPVIAYFSGKAERVGDYPVEKLTHIIYSFSHLKGNQLDIGNEASINTVETMVKLKQRNPDLKVILSLGGWGGCPTCSAVFSSDPDRKSFAASVKALLLTYKADGIDLDWEYPAVAGFPGHDYKPEDKPNFTRLVKTLRDTLGENYEISFAAGGFEKYLDEAIAWEEVAPLVNYVNLMSYDLVHGFSTHTGHHTPLYSTPEQLLSVDWGVKKLLARGVPRQKIIIGAAFYGRVFENVTALNSGLYQPGKFRSGESFRQITDLLQDTSYRYFWDKTAQAPFIYNARDKLFITYENRQSLRLKTQYVKDNQIGGIMFWELGLDAAEAGLLDEIYRVKMD